MAKAGLNDWKNSPVVRRQLQEKGLTVEHVEKQLERFQRGFPRIQLERPCTIGDGIRRLSISEEDEYIALYEEAAAGGRAMKFVPASGAATRMFRDLQNILSHYSRYRSRLRQGVDRINETQLEPLKRFVMNLPRFAFFEALQDALQKDGYLLETLLKNADYDILLEYLLSEKGLHYGQLPKALILFHRYPQGPRTPMEEHLVEGRGHVRDAQGRVRIHFTVPGAFRDTIARFLQNVGPRYAERGTRFVLDYSTQNPALDIVAVDFNNRLVQDASGRLVFRPGGHGALLENLNRLQGDIIFIKNIDNVVPDPFKAPVIRYKKVLGGILVWVQGQIFQFLRWLETPRVTSDQWKTIETFLRDWFYRVFPEDYHRWSPQRRRDFLRRQLNRPIRVCGMVKNQGEPGGGPFWVRGRDGTISLQIVEEAQVDLDDPLQQRVWQQATHFNPTDLVCGVRNYRGQPFDLMQFRDPETGFITVKYLNGKEIKVMELPGLWNGSMAFWNSIFVEVPLETFNPVKTVFDLLRPRHLDRANGERRQ